MNLPWLNFGGDPTSIKVAAPIEIFDPQTDLLTGGYSQLGSPDLDPLPCAGHQAPIQAQRTAETPFQPRAC